MRVRSEGVELAVQVQGEATRPAIILVHGYPDTHRVWSRVARELAREHFVVTYDVRGAGESSVPTRRRDYRLEHLVRDLGAVADATVPGRRFHLVGHDWGSIQSWEAVVTPGMAERVASFTSISGPSLDHVGEWLRDAPLELRARQTVRSWYVGAFHVPGLAPAMWRTVMPAFFRNMLKRTEGIDASDVAATLGDDGRHGIELYRANMLPHLHEPRPRRTDVPVQVVVLQRDSYVEPALAGLAERWANVVFRRELDVGHWGALYWHAPELAEWIGELVVTCGGA